MAKKVPNPAIKLIEDKFKVVEVEDHGGSGGWVSLKAGVFASYVYEHLPLTVFKHASNNYIFYFTFIDGITFWCEIKKEVKSD